MEQQECAISTVSLNGIKCKCEKDEFGNAGEHVKPCPHYRACLTGKQ